MTGTLLCPPAQNTSGLGAQPGPERAGGGAPPPSVGLVVTRPTGRASIAARQGDTLLAALKRAGLPIQSVCGGRAACGCCKLTVAADWIARLPPPNRPEGRLLAFLPDTRADERLACQITLTNLLEGLEIHLPA